MKEKFNKLINRYGYKELFFIVFYPIFLPLFMLKDTSFSIYNIIKALLKYDWKYLSGNDQKNAYNNFFYYIQDFNIQKFGRYGTSNLLVGDDYSLKSWFHATPFSLRMQSSFGTTFIMFFAMCFWLLSWIILYQDNPNLWILGVVFFSTLFFAIFIEIQNYNIIGWMLYPIFLTYLEDGSYLVLSLVLFLIALSSFTGFFIAGILVIISSIYLSDFYLLVTLLPGGIKWILPILISMKDRVVSKMFGAIGVYDKVKYRRKSKKRLSIETTYILGLQVQFLFFTFMINDVNFSIVLLAVIVFLFIVNELLIRFADQQSLYLAFLSVSIFYLLNVNFDYILLYSFMFTIFPIYGLIMNVRPLGNRFISPGVRKPFNAQKTIEDLSYFLDKAPDASRLLIAYENPKGVYEHLFYNHQYKVFNEIFQYTAILKSILVFPNWYFVFENNKENDDESFWIDNEKEAINYMKKNNITYILVPNFLSEEWKTLKLVDYYEFPLKENIANVLDFKIGLFQYEI